MLGGRGFEIIVGCGNEFDEVKRQLLEEVSKIIPAFLERECGSATAKAPVVVRLWLLAYPAFGSREVVHGGE